MTVGRIQSDEFEMKVVVEVDKRDCDGSEKRFLKCIHCNFFIPAPNSPPQAFVEKARAILDMKRHIKKTHPDALFLRKRLHDEKSHGKKKTAGGGR